MFMLDALKTHRALAVGIHYHLHGFLEAHGFHEGTRRRQLHHDVGGKSQFGHFQHHKLRDADEWALVSGQVPPGP
jgi:hypothetical protein